MATFHIIVKFYDPYPKEQEYRISATKMHTAVMKAVMQFNKGKRIMMGNEVTVKATRISL